MLRTISIRDKVLREDADRLSHVHAAATRAAANYD